MAAGVTQPGGAGTTIYYFDDSHADAGGDGSYSFTDIYAAMQVLSPGNTDFVDASYGGRTVYQVNVRLQCGDTGTTASTTTLTDTNKDVYFAPGVRWQWRATQTSSWFTNLGTKVGTGNRAGAKDGCNIIHGAGLAFQPLGVFRGYDCKFIMNGTSLLAFALLDNQGSELIECTCVNTSTGSFSMGGTATRFDNLYNVELCGNNAAGGLVSSSGAVASERITISAPSSATFIAGLVANLSFKDYKLVGSPTQCDYRWGNVTNTNWSIVQPKWSGNAAKFAQNAAGSMAVANGAKEYWGFTIKTVDSTGAAVANVPVSLTDTLGNVQINTTTDSEGRITFGSGLTANTVLVMDHYTVSQVYTQRHRSPFLLEVNTGASAVTGYSAVRTRFYWPGYEDITTSAGTFEDVNLVVGLQQASGTPSTWVEFEQP